MKKITFLIPLICLLLIAGCTNPDGTQGSGTPRFPLPQDGHITLGEGNRTFDASIDSIEVDPMQENGDQTITIYVAAKNAGSESQRFTWFSKLTDVNGKTYGGIKISHGGSGARTFWIAPNHTEMARDYVTIRSDRDLEVLKKGGILDVYFMRYVENASVSDIPDYHASWTINPGTIK